MIKWQVIGAGITNLRGVKCGVGLRFSGLQFAVSHAGLRMQKGRPAFLQKSEEGLVVRDDFRERPGFEPIMVVKDLDEPLGQHLRELQPAVV